MPRNPDYAKEMAVPREPPTVAEELEALKALEGFPTIGRPRMEIDADLVERSAAIGCTVEEISTLLGIVRSTFYLHLKEDPGLQDAIDRGREAGRASLRRMQWARAQGGSDTMLIWLGKQMLEQKDKLENSGTIDNRLKVIVEFVGDAAPQQVEHEKPQERFTPRLVNDVDWKG